MWSLDTTVSINYKKHQHPYTIKCWDLLRLSFSWHLRKPCLRTGKILSSTEKNNSVFEIKSDPSLTLVCATCLWAAIVECIDGRPFNAQPAKTSLRRSFTLGHWWGMSSNRLRSLKPWSLHQTKHDENQKSELTFDMFCQRLGTQLDELMQGEEIYNLPESTKDGEKHSTPRFLGETYSQKCHNADTDWYMRMPTNSPPFKVKVEMLLKLCKDQDTILGPSSSMTIISFHIEMGRDAGMRV